MRYYIIAGEASGDLHGANLMKAIKAKDLNCDFRFWGGDEMLRENNNIVKHIRDLAFMGFVEVVKHLGTVLSNIRFCKKDILQYRPDALILIDYPGFNLRIAKWAKSKGIKVIYYISPQIWAWKESRVHDIKRDVDKMIVILPFEKEFYKKYDMDVDYVGHPLSDIIKKAIEEPINNPINYPFVALLPGSRKQEIATKLPIMLSVVKHYKDYKFIIIKAPTISLDFYKRIIPSDDVQIVEDRGYNIRRQASAALVTSGTATLETALLRIPQIVCYKGNPVSYWLAKRLIKVKYISLVNLILDAPAIPELIQNNLNTEQLIKELDPIIENSAAKAQILKYYEELWHVLNKKNVSENAAIIITDFLKTIK